MLDGQGSVVDLVDSRGAVVNTYSYDLWGAEPMPLSLQAVEAVPQPLRYRGYWYDGWYDGARWWKSGHTNYANIYGMPLPWYWLGVRHYDPQLKRFLQPDPSAQDGVRSYTYCHDDPVNCTDPSGLAGGPIETPLPEGAGEPEPLLPPGEVLPATQPGGEAAAPEQLPLPFDEAGGTSGTGTTGSATGDIPTTVSDARETIQSPVGDATESTSQVEPRGGIYVLIDPETGEVVRTGMSTDLQSRESDHRAGTKDPTTKGMAFKVIYRTDDYEELRGLEQVVYDRYPDACLNKQRPISLRNPRRGIYLKAAANFLARNPGF